MRATDIGHGRGWLAAPAAASLARVDRDLGHPIQITYAGRSRAEQQRLRDLYLAGKGSYAAPPGSSPHETGIAIDTDDRPIAILAEHGWYRPLANEPWHFLYRLTQDKHRNAPATGAGKDDDMSLTPAQAKMLTENNTMLKQLTDYVGANGGMNTKTENTLGNKVDEIRDYLGARNGKDTKTPNTIGAKVDRLLDKGRRE